MPRCKNSLRLSFVLLIVLQGKVMHQVGIEVVGQGALTLTMFLKELMERKNMPVGSLYTIRTLKEVSIVPIMVHIG